MTPTILAKDGKLFMVTGSPGGRTIINTVLETIVDVVDFGMNAQEAVDAPRFHHQWLPDRISYERHGFSPDTLRELQRRGHALKDGGRAGRGAGHHLQREGRHARRRHRSAGRRWCGGAGHAEAVSAGGVESREGSRKAGRRNARTHECTNARMHECTNAGMHETRTR